MMKVKLVKGRTLRINGIDKTFYSDKVTKVNKKEYDLIKDDNRLQLIGGSSDKEDDEEEKEPRKYTESELKKMSAKEQKEVIEALGRDSSLTSNEKERINLILDVQSAF